MTSGHSGPSTGHTEELIHVAQATGPSASDPTARPEAGASRATLERLRRDVAHALDRPVEAIGDEADLLDLGLDSIRLMSLLQTWTQPGRELDLADFVEDPRLASWALHVGPAGS